MVMSVITCAPLQRDCGRVTRVVRLEWLSITTARSSGMNAPMPEQLPPVLVRRIGITVLGGVDTVFVKARDLPVVGAYVCIRIAALPGLCASATNCTDLLLS